MLENGLAQKTIRLCDAGSTFFGSPLSPRAKKVMVSQREMVIHFPSQAQIITVFPLFGFKGNVNCVYIAFFKF